MAGGFDSQLLRKSVDMSGCVFASTMVSCEICMSHLSSLERDIDQMLISRNSLGQILVGGGICGSNKS
jgi:hypothetical protein